MKKIISLIKACMTSDMNIFKIKQKKNKKNKLALPLILTFFVMFSMWSSANSLFEETSSLHIQEILLTIVIFGFSIMTVIEGIYKSNSLLYNCKDDQLLLSLPIKRSTVVFIRMLKFYVFELMFNTIFTLPFMIAYIRWADSINGTFFITSIVMLLTLPIIPIAISCIIGMITSSVSSRFKYKNLAQTIIAMVFILAMFYLSYSINSLFDFIAAHATSINDFINKVYYPAGTYYSLLMDFNILTLIIYILINILVLITTILVLSKYYFKINSRLKGVTTTKKTKTKELVFKKRGIYQTLMRKELNTFFNIPVFIVNAGFALVLFLLAVIAVVFKYDSFIEKIKALNIEGLTPELIKNNLSIIIFTLVSVASFLTSITNSVISLEGRNINILKTLPVKTKTILMSKIYACSLITTPVLLLGEIILFIKFKTNIIEALLLVVLALLIPLVSHFIGILVNLKYPKLDAENPSEVVKQSVSSFISVMIGMLLFIATIMVVVNLTGNIPTIYIILIATILFIIINIILYLLLIKKGVKEFNQLSI